MRGYYPGEREYRERPQPRIRKPRVPEGLDRDLHLPKPRLRRAPAAEGVAGTAAPEAAVAAAAPVAAGVSRSTGRRIDWAIGILLGVVLGVAVVIAFLVFGSEGTIDAPSVHGVNSDKPPAQTRSHTPTHE